MYVCMYVCMYVFVCMYVCVCVGLGYALWDAGVGLGIWLGLNRDKLAGKRILELGSGVGIAGVAAALVGAKSVVLSGSRNCSLY